MGHCLSARLDESSFDDSMKQSPTPSLHSSTSPILSVPPELLSYILSLCGDSNYLIEKTVYFRLCLVNRQFFFPSRQLLYRKDRIYMRLPFSQINMEEMDQKARKLYRRDNQVSETLETNKHIAVLVKELTLMFEALPPGYSEAIRINRLLDQLPCLEKFWLLDDGSNFWGRDELGCDDGLLEIISRLVEKQQNTLKVLVVPQMRLNSAFTEYLFSKMSSLDTYKGTIFTRPDPDEFYFGRSGGMAASISKLSRAYITEFEGPEDLAYLFRPSHHSLRFLHLVLRLDNGPIDLGNLPLLETLTISTRLVDQGRFSLGGPVRAVSQQEVIASMEETPYALLKNVLKTIESVKYSSSVTSCSVITDLDSYFEERSISEPFVLALPSSLVELAFGPNHVSAFPWLYLLQNRRLYPSLRKIVLTLPPDVDTKTASKALFGVEDLKAAEGIQVGWLKKEKDWRVWKQRQFYPEGSNFELMGRVNKLTLEEIKKVTCIVS